MRIFVALYTWMCLVSGIICLIRLGLPDYTWPVKITYARWEYCVKAFAALVVFAWGFRLLYL